MPVGGYALALGVVGDAVEHVGFGAVFGFGQDACEVDHPLDDARSRVDDDDLLGGVDVGPDFTLDPLQFVEVVDGLSLVGDGRALLAPESRGVDRMDAGRTVGHVELLPVGGQPPPLAGVAEVAELPHGGRVVDVAGVGVPGQLVEPAVEQGDSLAELRTRQARHRPAASCGKVGRPQDRLPILARSLPKDAVGVLQPLRVGVGGVGVGGLDAVSVFGGFALPWGCRCGGRGAAAGGAATAGGRQNSQQGEHESAFHRLKLI